MQQSKSLPFHSQWTFRYSSRSKPHQSNPESTEQELKKSNHSDNTTEYKQRLNDMATVSNMHQFFTVYQHLQRPSQLPRELQISMFRKDQEPLWQSSPNGGCWIIKVRKPDNIDAWWQRLLFACVGEQFEGSLNIIGALLSLRMKERLIEVWLKDGRYEKKRYEVCKMLKVMLDLPTEVAVYYKQHDKSMQDGSTMKNAQGFKFTRKKKVKGQQVEWTNQNNWENKQGWRDNNYNNSINREYHNVHNQGQYGTKSKYYKKLDNSRQGEEYVEKRQLPGANINY